jgi:spore coat polysaccharide biosynthesis protein SpsF
LRIGCLISARNKSKRLKNKLFLKINNIPIISGLIIRLSNLKLRFKHELVMCTSDDKKDLKLVKIAKMHRIKFFKGSKDDKLLRYYNCAKKNKYDIIIIIDGDDPLIYVEGINALVDHYQRYKQDYLFIKNLPVGLTPSLIKTSALKYVLKKKKSKNTEVWANFFLSDGKIRSSAIKIGTNISSYNRMRFTLDYKEDYNFFKKILKILDYDWTKCALEIIREINEKNKHLFKVNIKCQNKYLKHLNNSVYNLN